MSAISEDKLQQVLGIINQNADFNGVGVVFIHSGGVRVLRESSLPKGLGVWMVIEEKAASTNALQEGGSNEVSAPTDGTNITKELLDAGISCGGAVVVGVAGVASLAGAPLTGGTSLAISIPVFSAAVAAAWQCGTGIGRVSNEIFSPENNDYLDSASWYKITAGLMDGVALSTGVLGMHGAVQNLIRLQKASGRPFTQLLRNFNREQRKKISKELAQILGKIDKTADWRKFRELTKTTNYPKVFTQKQITSNVVASLLEPISSILTVAGSARGGNINALYNMYFAEEK